MIRLWPRRWRRAEPALRLVCEPWPGPPAPLPGGAPHEGGVWTTALAEPTEPMPLVVDSLLRTPAQRFRAGVEERWP